MMPLLAIMKRLILLKLQLLVQMVVKIVEAMITTCKFRIVDNNLHALGD
jgi:hypothetical protein